jgi:hypothetical protein
MTQSRVGERDRVGAEWFGAPNEGQVPVRAGGTGGVRTGDKDAPAPGTRWTRRLLRVLRDAAIGAAILAMVPVGLTSLVGTMTMRSFTPFYENTRSRLTTGELSRAFAPAKDPSITPIEAGEALVSLQPRPNGIVDGFALRRVERHYEHPWKDAPVAKGMFDEKNRNSSWNGPSSTTILRAATGKLDARELDYLKMVATAPEWVEFDRIARAPAMDYLGARFEIPFDKNALAFQRPIVKFAATKEMAYAGVSRAAYYLAIGDKAKADAALRNIIGFGFALVDNGTSTIDALIGRVIVGIGRDALQQLYEITGDPRLVDVKAAVPPGGNTPRRVSSPDYNQSLEAMRDRSLRTLTDATVPRAIKFEILQQLALSSCTNPRELLFGPRPEITKAFENAERDLARFPSERALLEMTRTTTERPAPDDARIPEVARVVIGASTIGSVVLQNPRMAFCSRVVIGMGFPR